MPSNNHRPSPGAPPLNPPPWAQHSIHEDGGITHEIASPRKPLIRQWGPNGSELVPTEVILTATDLHIDGEWIRTLPTIQIEGGNYSLEGAQELRTILDAFLNAAANDTTSTIRTIY